MTNTEQVWRVFFERSQAIVRAEGLDQKLSLLARAVVDSGLFGRAAVQIYESAYGAKLLGSAGISPEQEAWLRSHDIIPASTYQRVRAHAVHLGGPIYFIPHDRLTDVLPGSEEALLPSQLLWKGPGWWHPDDMLYCQLTSSTGVEMGNLTADEPGNGRIPDAATAELLGPFVSLAAAMVEQDLNRRRDQLTGCYEGRVTRHEIERRARTGEPFGLLFCDMDELKAINDERGHAAGDRAIREAARALDTVAALPPLSADWVGRLHGDEFVVLFWGFRDWAEEDLAREIRRAWAKAVPQVSVGLALARPREEAGELIRRAELDMYRDKRRRKGRV
jgi:diguanylate cyclase (GGDEF)-like protein